MKRFVLGLYLIIGCTSALWSADRTPLTNLSAVAALSHPEAAHEFPVVAEATVTYYRSSEQTMFVQDGKTSLYMMATTDLDLVPGDRILVRGTTRVGLRPYVLTNDVTLLHHGKLPTPLPATFDQLSGKQHDGELVAMRGVVRSADLTLRSGVKNICMQILTEGGVVDAYVDDNNASALKGMLDAEVEIVGIAGAKLDGKNQQTGILLHVTSLKSIKILKRASANPWSLPITPMDSILGHYHLRNMTQRIRVEGTLTFYQPRSSLVLQSGDKSLQILTQIEEPLSVGHHVEVTGFPDVRDGFLILTNGEVQESQRWEPVAPRPVTRKELTSSKYGFDLVSIEGQVVMEVREGRQDLYVLLSDGQLFSAVYTPTTSIGMDPSTPMKQVPLGSRVSVTGICVLESSNPFVGDVPFKILMQKPEDIIVVAKPTWRNVRNLSIVVGILLTIVFIGGLRSWTIERKVRRQTAAMATLERQRSRILEDINGSRPLAEIIEQIVEMISFSANGAPCWCEITGGATLGNRPPSEVAFRIIRENIPGRSGPMLGAIFLAVDDRVRTSVEEIKALSVGARLTTLAIETRKLYTDLFHRSEFDLLTDIHNRFSLDKQLDAHIDEARQSAGVFGLIYIDLDKFKLVNDTYGHHIGDLYLQEVTRRMKLQLRSSDLLARLGGDEFAALVSIVHTREDVAEIAQRLECCFDKPFLLEGHSLTGSASIGLALYPQDGKNKDSLLRSADAAMYAVKRARQAAESAETDS